MDSGVLVLLGVSALTAVTGKRFGDSTGVVPAANKTETAALRRYAAKGRIVTIATREIDGRMVVAYVEVPEGANASLVDLARVTLR